MVDFEMTECLISNQLFLLVPFSQRHDRCPDLREAKSVQVSLSSMSNVSVSTYNSDDFMFWNDILLGQFLDVIDYILLRLVVFNIIDDCLRQEKKKLVRLMQHDSRAICLSFSSRL
jgi:hypothetical protein